MPVSGSGSAAAAAAARAAAEAARKAAAEAARKRAAEAARQKAQAEAKKKAAEQARKQASEAAKKAQAQAQKAREAQQNAQKARKEAAQAQQKARAAKGPDKSKLADQAKEANKKAEAAQAKAKQQLDRFRELAADGEKKAEAAQRASQAANEAAVAEGKKAPFRDAQGFEQLRDSFDEASKVQSGRDFNKLFGSNAASADARAIDRATNKDFYSDQQIKQIANRVPMPGTGGDERVAASERLKAELKNLPPQDRARLVKELGPKIEEMAKGANGTPDEDDRKAILSNLADSAVMSGPEGTKEIVNRFANVAVNDHTDVDNGDQLGGALKDVINEEGGEARKIFGYALGQELQKRDGLGDCADNVLQGTYEADKNLNPSKLDRTWDDIKEKVTDIAGDVLKAFGDAFDFVTKPMTDAINGQVDKLGPGDSYNIHIDASVAAALEISGAGDLTVARGDDGKYTVSAEGSLSVGLGDKLGNEGIAAAVGGGGKVEFSFDNKEDAKRAADTVAQIGAAAIASSNPLLAAAAPTAIAANLADGDLQFCASNISAVEFGPDVSADFSEKMNLPGMKDGEGAGLTAKGSARYRVEFTDPPSLSVTSTLTGTAEAGIGIPAGAGGVTLNGQASAQVQIQNKLTLPKGFELGDLGNIPEVANNSKWTTSVNLQLQQQASIAGNVGPFAGGAQGTLTENLSFTGNPATILKQGIPRVLDGNIGGAVKALGDNADVNASVELDLQGQAGPTANVNGGLGSVTSGGQKGIEARLKLSGDPVEIATKAGPKLLRGDFPGAIDAAGDRINVEAELTRRDEYGTSIHIGDPIGIVDANFATERVDVGNKPLWSYGVDDPSTRRNEGNKRLSNVPGDVMQQWNRVWGKIA